MVSSTRLKSFFFSTNLSSRGICIDIITGIQHTNFFVFSSLPFSCFPWLLFCYKARPKRSIKKSFERFMTRNEVMKSLMPSINIHPRRYQSYLKDSNKKMKNGKGLNVNGTKFGRILKLKTIPSPLITKVSILKSMKKK